jgi:hypothetical protein
VEAANLAYLRISEVCGMIRLAMKDMYDPIRAKTARGPSFGDHVLRVVLVRTEK